MKSALRHVRPSMFPKHDLESEKVAACPSFEALEHRVLLSGDVLASVVHGNLNIRGDLLGNNLVVTPGVNAGEVVITSGADATTINGLSGPITLHGVTGNVDIRMGAGDDILTMSNLSLLGKVSINGQKGANTLTLNNVQVANNLKILSVTTATIADTTVGKDLQMNLTGPGGENVALRSVTVQRNTKITTGKGPDILTIDDSTFHGAARLNTGQGADIIAIEAHGDAMGPPTLFDGPVSISLGAGDDTLRLGVTGQTGNRSVFADKASFNGGKGRDTLLNFDASTYAGLLPFRIMNFESNTTTAPTAAITPVSPDPRNTAVSSIQIVFSEAVTGFTKADLTLTGVDLTTATLTSADNITWTLGNLTGLTGSAGTYTLALGMTGLTDLAGTPGVGTVSEQWVTDTTAPTAAITPVSPDPRNTAVSSIQIVFSEAVTGFTKADLTLTGVDLTTATLTSADNITWTLGNLTGLTGSAGTYTLALGMTGLTDLAGTPGVGTVSEQWVTDTTAQAPIDLGRAAPFAVMATDAISGSANVITGDVGLNPGSSQGINPAQIDGTIHIDDQAVIDAQTDLLAAYNDAIGRSVALVTVSGNLGGSTFTPGLYWSSSTLAISGAPGPGNTVTLDAQGDPNAVFIFQMGSTLTTGPGAEVILAGNANPNNIFWQVGSSATLDTTTIFYGNILAAVTITVNDGAAVLGRLFAGADGTPSGAVTIQRSTVTVPV